MAAPHFLPLLALSVGPRCFSEGGRQGACGPGFERCSVRGFGSAAPQYHVMDASCFENDPNSPVYDPVHKLYHLFYQKHAGGGMPVYGHVVSRDLTHWARLPVAIWNDRPYDSLSIYTGSATVVDGKVVQVYPGVCQPTRAGCSKTGYTLNVALPADETDPFLRNWTKPDYNPIVLEAERDPTTAWRERSGEWRMVEFSGQMYGSVDFVRWYTVGAPGASGFPTGECPAFFELPPLTPGAAQAAGSGALPTHVFKVSQGGYDYAWAGSYVEAGRGEPGAWTAQTSAQVMDRGDFYAAKDFWDPVKGRRIAWGWATVKPKSAQSLPRELTWHPQLRQLVFAPLAEQAALRTATLASVAGVHLRAGETRALHARGASGAGSQAEVECAFALPAAPACFGVAVLGGSLGVQQSGVFFFVDFTPAAEPGEPYGVAVGRRLHGAGGAGRCPAETEGGHRHGSLVVRDELRLLPEDDEIRLRIFVDGTMAEAFWQGGRVVLTSDSGRVQPSRPRDAAVDVVALAGAAVYLRNATVHAVGSIWVPPESLLVARAEGALERRAEAAGQMSRHSRQDAGGRYWQATQQSPAQSPRASLLSPSGG